MTLQNKILLLSLLLTTQSYCEENNWLLDSRFSTLNIQKAIDESYPKLHKKSVLISHYSGLHSINPFLLAELSLTKNLEIKLIAEHVSETLTKEKSLYLNPTTINSINKMMAKYKIPNKQQKSTSANRPAFDLPFDHDKAWYFRGVHTNTGFDEEGVPLSAMDISSDWDLDWGFTVINQWVAAAHSGVVTVFSSCYMRITHESGWGTGYYHLENIQYRTGDVVNAGDKIANFASTYSQAICLGGEADTPHVHFELLKDGASFPLDGIDFSGWRIHAGEFSYDTRRDHMWMEKDGVKKYALTDTIDHENGFNHIDYRYSGLFSSSEIDGHGINISISQIKNTETEIRNVVFVAFYTYNDEGKTNFYVGNIDFDIWRADESKTIEMIQTSNGNFTDMQPIDFSSDVINAGTLEIMFIDCSTVEISFQLLEPTSVNEVNHNLNLTKTIGIPDHVCKAPSLPLNPNIN